jgi:cbb3-type cytochrome c oxidase subunit III
MTASWKYGFGVALVAALLPMGVKAQAAPPLPTGVTQAMVDQGKTLFGASCIGCHGQDAKGSAFAPNLTDAEWLHSDGSFDKIVETITKGVATPKNSPMPMMAKGGATLTDAQVKAVAAYVWRISHSN